MSGRQLLLYSVNYRPNRAFETGSNAFDAPIEPICLCPSQGFMFEQKFLALVLGRLTRGGPDQRHVFVDKKIPSVTQLRGRVRDRGRPINRRLRGLATVSGGSAGNSCLAVPVLCPPRGSCVPMLRPFVPAESLRRPCERSSLP
jgi:hypothetical protein